MEPIKIGPLGELQVKLLRILWREPAATVGELTAALWAQSLDYQPRYVTVMTVLRRLEARGLVAHRRRDLAKRDQAFIYFPVVTEAAVRRALVEELAQSLFDGVEELRAFLTTAA